MRALLWFLAAIFGTLVLAALVAWPLWLVVHMFAQDLPFHRIVSRFWQLLLLGGLLFALRGLGLRGRADWGYGLQRPVFLRHFAAGLAIGVATMLPMSLAMGALGIHTLRPGFGPAMLLEAIASGALAGLAVSILEETFFRGLMFRAVSRESGFAVAAWGTALVYAAIHFLARARIPSDEVVWDSGIRLLGGALANFAEPLTNADSFITLVLVGLLLACARQRTGAIAAGIGLHMGWVWVIKATTAVTRVDTEARASFLVGSFDGYTGWLVAGWAALLLVAAFFAGWLRPEAGATR
ncbi:MAG TPA: CPBP family intramembrane glutamic endopeptidase [Steroidobacteraceae bacterium]